MLGLSFHPGREARVNVLCIGAHSDDIEIGCGGTVLRLIDECDSLIICWIVFGADERRKAEALASANGFLKSVQEKTVRIESFRDGFFPYLGSEIKTYFEELKREVDPDIIFTHYRNDLHQDHRLISDLTWNTFRDHLILEYEIPKYDGDLGTPNFFVHLDESLSRRKSELVLNHFESQRGRDWFTEDTFLALLRMRGVESRSPGRYAEAFHCRKMVFRSLATTSS